MKKGLSKWLAFLVGLAVFDVSGAPPSAQRVPFPVGGVMAAGPIGGQLQPGLPIGGALTPSSSLLLAPNNGIPGGTLTSQPFLSPTAGLSPAGGALNTGGVGGTFRPMANQNVIILSGANAPPGSVIVAGSNPGGTLSSRGVGGSSNGVIIVGGNSSAPAGGTLNSNGVGGAFTP